MLRIAMNYKLNYKHIKTMVIIRNTVKQKTYVLVYLVQCVHKACVIINFLPLKKLMAF